MDLVRGSHKGRGNAESKKRQTSKEATKKSIRFEDADYGRKDATEARSRGRGKKSSSWCNPGKNGAYLDHSQESILPIQNIF